MTRYGIGIRRMIRRESLDLGGASESRFVLDERLGLHPTSRAAKVSFIQRFEPHLTGDYAVRHFDQQARNIGDVTVLRVAIAADTLHPQIADRSVTP